MPKMEYICPWNEVWAIYIYISLSLSLSLSLSRSPPFSLPLSPLHPCHMRFFFPYFLLSSSLSLFFISSSLCPQLAHTKKSQPAADYLRIYLSIDRSIYQSIWFYLSLSNAQRSHRLGCRSLLESSRNWSLWASALSHRRSRPACQSKTRCLQWDDAAHFSQESPRQTKPKKGPKRKVYEFRPFLWILVFFLGKTSTIHIESLFRNAPARSSWTDLSLVWFAGATGTVQRAVGARPTSGGSRSGVCLNHTFTFRFSCCPDPPIPAFLPKKRGTPAKSRDFPLRRALYILGKESKKAQSKENRKNEKKWGEQKKKQGLVGSGCLHANGGIIHGGVACICAKWCVSVHYCALLALFYAFLCLLSYQNGLQKKRKFAQNSAKMCKKRFLCNTPFSCTPFACHRSWILCSEAGPV